MLGHIGSRGTAYWNVRLLCEVLPELEEIRIHSRRPQSRDSAGRTGWPPRPVRNVTGGDSWEEACAAPTWSSRPPGSTQPEPLLRTEWIEPGALVVPYGTVSAVELSLTDIMDKVVVDDWGQVGAGPLGALRAHVDCGRLITVELLHAEIGEIVCGARPGREASRRDHFVLAPRIEHLRPGGRIGAIAHRFGGECRYHLALPLLTSDS